MSAARDYFRNIGDAVRTTFIGMKITLKYWVKEPSITVEYPDRIGGKKPEDLAAERFRGFLGVETAHCIGCLQCMRACPLDAILIRVEKKEETRYLTRFDIDQAKCMYCGLCVEACPTAAIGFTKRFEGACYDIGDLLMHHVTDPAPAARQGKKEGA